MTREKLDKMDQCRHLLPKPGPEVVGELIVELRKAENRMDDARAFINELIILSVDAKQWERAERI